MKTIFEIKDCCKIIQSALNEKNFYNTKYFIKIINNNRIKVVKRVQNRHGEVLAYEEFDIPVDTTKTLEKTRKDLRELCLSCLSKETFYKKREANKIADRYKQRIYKCPHCNAFHLTSKRKKSI